jgi:hypothetical protein
VPWFVIMKIFEPILNIVCECMNIIASSYQSTQAQQESALARAGEPGARHVGTKCQGRVSLVQNDKGVLVILSITCQV